MTECKAVYGGSYHVSYNSQLVDYSLGSQLGLTDHTSQESSNLKNPPLQTKHEHTWDGQSDEGAPLLQTVQGPTCRPEVSWLHKYVEKHVTSLLHPVKHQTQPKELLRYLYKNNNSTALLYEISSREYNTIQFTLLSHEGKFVLDSATVPQCHNDNKQYQQAHYLNGQLKIRSHNKKKSTIFGLKQRCLWRWEKMSC